jgi:hypothetical protein
MHKGELSQVRDALHFRRSAEYVAQKTFMHREIDRWIIRMAAITKRSRLTACYIEAAPHITLSTTPVFPMSDVCNELFSRLDRDTPVSLFDKSGICQSSIYANCLVAVTAFPSIVRSAAMVRGPVRESQDFA